VIVLGVRTCGLIAGASGKVTNMQERLAGDVGHGYARSRVAAGWSRICKMRVGKDDADQ